VSSVFYFLYATLATLGIILNNVKMIEDLLILLIIILISIFIVITILSRFYKKCPPGCIIVVFNNNQDAYGSTYKIVKSGGAYVWPFGGSYVIFDLSPFNLKIDIEKLIDNQGKAYQLSLKAILSISSEENVLQKSIERISGLSKEKIDNIVSDLIISHIRSYFAGISGEEYKNRENFKLSLTSLLVEPLEEFGIKILNVDVVEVNEI
jgi:uncharacterized membrane protein YqiK